VSPHSRTIRLLLGAGVLSCGLSGAPALAAEQPQQPAEDWRVVTQGPYGFTSGGAAGSYFFGSMPATAFTGLNATRGFSDILVGRNLGFARDLGFDSMHATFGARMAEPLTGSGVAPAFEDRRHVGIGPRLGLDGSKQLPSSWTIDWQVGAAMLFGDRTADGNGGATSLLPNYAATNRATVNVDGLLGLSYWFNAASKLMVGYRADAYLKAPSSFSAGVPATPSAERLDHGPVVRFTIQK
jgi:hypothetical protein